VASELIFTHLYNDYSGSPRILRDAIETSLTLTSNIHVITSGHQGFLDKVAAPRSRLLYAKGNHRYTTLAGYLVSQVHLLLLVAYRILVARAYGRSPTVIVNTLLPFGAAISAWLLRVQVIYYLHESSISPPSLKLLLRTIAASTSQHAIFVSRWLMAAESLDGPKQHLLYNGLGVEFFPQPEIDRSRKFRERRVLFAGSLKAYKGIDHFVELASRLPELNFIAALNCQEDQLSAYFGQRTLPSNLRILARPKNLRQLFIDSFCVVNLSIPDQCIETFGLSLLEGMICGTPVVAPPIGGPLEFVDTSCGLLADSRDTEVIVQFLTKIANDEDAWSSMSKQAALHAMKFSPESYQSSLRSILGEMGVV
jgi:glycosyltransferase involved in cell wall biosynthesis